MRYAGILLLVVLFVIAGCTSFCNWARPITPVMLDQTAQGMLQAKDKVITELKIQIDKLKNAPSNKGDWIFAGSSGFSILAFAVSVYAAIMLNFKAGIAGAISSLLSLALSVTFWMYKKPIAIGCAIFLMLIAVGAIAYCIWRFRNAFSNVTANIDKTETEVLASVTNELRPAREVAQEVIATLKKNLFDGQIASKTKGIVDKVRGK